MFSNTISTGLAAGLVLFALFSAHPAEAASGQALGVRQDAVIETHDGSTTLTVGADVFIGDKVVTGPTGNVQILFADQTKLVVGPSSALVIADYLLRDDQSAGKFAVDALSGTFRFVTGKAAKDRYLISTPTGTIGVRGTGFDFDVDARGTTVLLYHGAVRLCNLAGQCVSLDDTCEIGRYDLTDSQVLGAPNDMTEADRRALAKAFPYANSQGALLGRFWIEQARQCFNRKPANGAPAALGDGDSSPGTQEIPSDGGNGGSDDPGDLPEGCWMDGDQMICT